MGPVVRIPPGGSIAAGQRTMHLRANPSVVRPRYLFYLLTSPVIQDRLSAMAMGSTVPHLRVADVKAFMLPGLPRVKDQDRIQEVLGSLDDKIAVNVTTTDTITELLAAHAENLGLDDFESAHKLCALEDVLHLNPLTPAPREAEPVYLGMQDLPTSDMTVLNWDHREARGGARFRNGDTLIARITPCLENRKTGFVDFLPTGAIGIGSTEYIVLRARPGVPAALSYFVATSERFREFAIRHMVGTSGRQRVSAKDLAEYEIAIPDSDNLDRFGLLAEPMLESMAMLRDERRTLAELRDTLLPHLMSGRLRVKEAEKQVEAVV